MDINPQTIADKRSKTMSISLIILTYQWPQALNLVLASALAQTTKVQEILIADDGSDLETKQVVVKWQQQSTTPIHHVWQADQGFRAAEARNKAAAMAHGDYLIFVDGDCLLFSDFIARHRALSEIGYFTAGHRILLNQALSTLVLQGQEYPPDWSLWRWLSARLSGTSNRVLPLLKLGDGAWRKYNSHQWQGAKSCNLAIWRHDFSAVNGFDESYTGWGHEDADLVARLIANGCLRKDGRYAAPVIHLWHNVQSRQLTDENRQRLQQVLQGQRTVVASRGLSAHNQAS